jgi:hypothetical protein
MRETTGAPIPSQFVAVLEDDERRRTGMKPLLLALCPQWEPVFFDNAPDMLE